jgi:hypothetical protein
MTDASAGQPTGELQLKTSFFFLMWILYFIKPRLEVNGHALPLDAWGETRHRLNAGSNQVSVYFPYLFPKRAGEAVATVDVPADGVVRLEYRAPWIVFLAGKLQQTAPV